jgi:membrane protease YdiL (CAAX protease family)
MRMMRRRWVTTSYIATKNQGVATMEKKNFILLVEYLIIATVLIVTSFTPYKLVGMLVVIAYMIIESRLRKREKVEPGFYLKGLPLALRDNWLPLLLVVLVTPLLTVFVGKLFLPEYFTHVLDRVIPYVKIDSLEKLLGQLLVLAFGEEIVFRAFLQGRLSLFINPRMAIILSSIVFAAVHFTSGVMVVVIMDLLSVFVDSLLFGIIFERSKNVLASTVAHFLGNSFGILLLIFLSQGLV